MQMMNGCANDAEHIYEYRVHGPRAHGVTSSKSLNIIYTSQLGKKHHIRELAENQFEMHVTNSKTYVDEVIENS